MQMASQRYRVPSGARFSILIPTWNNLAYLKLCVESLRKHSAFPHQIILHLNDGRDGSLAWAREQGLDHTHSADNIGVCHALNAAAELAATDYICFFNDDMYALPDWDRPLWAEIERLDHPRWFLSGTMIEPTDTGNSCVIAPQNYGIEPAKFRVLELLATHTDFVKQDWTGATWPPNVVPRTLWEEVGGYSAEFSPGMSSDPDFSMKLWQAGVRHFRGIAASRVYHFQARSTGKVIKNDGPRQFLEKWGITQGTFSRLYLRRGQPWRGPLPEAGPGWALQFARLRGWWKRHLL